MPTAAASDLAIEVRHVAMAAGLDAVGFTTAEPFGDARVALESRRAAGMDGGMQFTYRNPARSTDPGRALPGARSIAVGARSYLRRPPEPLATAATGGRVARYAWEDHYAPLRRALGAVAGALREAGHRAVVLADDNAMVDRAAAVRAGIGWYGNNANVLLPGRGSWFVLGSVVTDAELPVTDPAAADATAGGCGTCTRCLPACPTGALVEPGVLDARRCLAWLVQAPGPIPHRYREAVGDRIYGCDDCQEVCPVNHLGSRRHPPPPASSQARPAVDVLALLAATDEEMVASWGRWYLPGREARYVRRNALVVLGNTGDPDDAPTRQAIRAALGHDDPLVRAHAVWAAGRLGLLDTARDAGIPDDPDGEVRAEWALATSGRV